jgi:serine/threonine protein kinase
LADFSIARLLDETRTKLTNTGRVMGTPAYMSAEQFMTGKVGPTSDLYSLGVMLFEMVTGRLPFEADSLVELVRKQSAEPPRPRELRPELPGPAEAVIWQALAKHSEERFASGAALARAFTAGLEGRWDPAVRPIVPITPRASETTVVSWSVPKTVQA